jgi:hypothetical protein
MELAVGGKRHQLINTLRDRLAIDGSVAVTHIVGTPSIPEPPLIGDEQPDLLARGLGNKLIIGLAKTGPDFSDEESIRQYRAFAAHHDQESDERAAFDLVVPAEFRRRAEVALEEAGLTEEQFFVIGLPFHN